MGNEECPLTNKELKEIVEECAIRVEEIEMIFPIKGEVMYYLSGLMPVAMIVVATVLTVVGTTPQQKEVASDIMKLALIGLVLYRIDRVFEYVKTRFDMYDAMSGVEEENEQPAKD